MSIQGFKRHRGFAQAVAADMTNTQIHEDLMKIVNEFKDKHAEELKGIEKRFDDVVSREQVDRINDSITETLQQLEAVNARIQQMEIGAGSQDGVTAEQREHYNAFETMFRRGADANLRDLEIKAALSTDSDPDGGYVVPTEMERQIDQVHRAVQVFRQLANVMQIGTDEYSKLVNVGTAGAGWVGEREARPETATPQLKQLKFPTMELYANPATTQKMLDDGIVDVGAWLADEVSIAFAEQEADAFINGDGVNKPKGILAYPTVANASYTWGKVGFVTTGVNGGFVAPTDTVSPGDTFIDLLHALRQGYRAGASFLMNDTTHAAVRKLKTGTHGDYLWQAPSTASEAVPTILQKPVYSDDFMPDMANNSFSVAVGNWQRAYTIFDRIGIRVLRDPYTNKPFVHFYTTKRVGGGLTHYEPIKLLKFTS